MTKTKWLTLGILLSAALSVLAEEKKQEKAAPSLAHFETKAKLSPDFPSSIPYPNKGGIILPNASLPANVPAPSGQLTLFADYQKADQKRNNLPLYLVNRSDEVLELFSHDGDVNLKLEYQDKEGNWVRAECSSNWFGEKNSEIRLPPGTHYLSAGYFPKNGTAALVRFSSYQLNSSTLHSNTSQGFFRPSALADTELDMISYIEIPHTIRDHLAIIASEEPYDGNAIHPEKFLTCVEAFSHYHNNQLIRHYAEAASQSREDDPNFQQAIAVILGRDWPPVPNHKKLVLYCLETIDSPLKEDKESFSHKDPEIAWSILVDCLSNIKFKDLLNNDSALRMRCLDALPSALASPNSDLASAASGILRASVLVNEHFTNEQLCHWMTSPSYSVFRAAAVALRNRVGFKHLVQQAHLLEEERQVAVFEVLLNHPPGHPEIKKFRNPETKEERAYWLLCFERQPHMVANVLASRSLYREAQLPSFLRPPLKAYLTPLLKEPEEKVFGHFRNLERHLRVLAQFKEKEDLDFFLQQLTHPAFTDSFRISADEETTLRRYYIRETAADFLHSIGQNVPDGSILEETLPGDQRTR